MKFLNNKKIIIPIIGLTIIILSILVNVSNGMQYYQTVGSTTGIVTATKLNVRSGPTTSYGVVTQISKNEYVRVFAQIGSWYVIQTDKDYIGMGSNKYIKLLYSQSANNSNSSNSNQVTSSLTNDEMEVFNLINQKRTSAGLAKLKIDDETQNVARIKAKEMVDSNYFSHTSPTYGSPFDMLKSFKVSYKTAGENIAGNSSNSKAVEAWMNSEGHKANILNSSFNYTGIGVVNGSKYGKIYVQMFIGK